MEGGWEGGGWEGRRGEGREGGVVVAIGRGEGREEGWRKEGKG